MNAAPPGKPGTAETYRRPMSVCRIRISGRTGYYICPRCSITMDREFIAYCSRCGQCLDWKGYKKAVIVK